MTISSIIFLTLVVHNVGSENFAESWSQVGLLDGVGGIKKFITGTSDSNINENGQNRSQSMISNGMPGGFHQKTRVKNQGKNKKHSQSQILENKKHGDFQQQQQQHQGHFRNDHTFATTNPPSINQSVNPEMAKNLNELRQGLDRGDQKRITF